MTDKERNILAIVRECETIQRSNESDYAKDRAQIAAYEHIRDIILGGDDDGEE